MQNGLKVFAPASVANIAVGYDILGFALEAPGDELIGRIVDRPGVHITSITGDQGRLPKDPLLNTAGFAALKVLEHLGEKKGIEMELRKKMPFGSGLGSSAASAVGGAMLVNELFNKPMEKRDLLPFAVMAEQLADGAFHADNVAPSLLGGIILIRSNKELDVHRLPVPTGLYASVVYPNIEVLTKNARSILSEHISLEQHIEQSGNLAGFIHGLYQSDIDLIGRSLKDFIIEPQRASLIPYFYEVKEAAMNAGALGCSISGAGPSMFALSANALIAEQAATAMVRVFKEHRIRTKHFLSSINQEGAVRC